MNAPADLVAALAAALAPVVEAAEERLRAVLREELERQARPVAELLTVEAFAELHRLTPPTIRSYIKAGRLVAERRGRQWRIRSDAAIAPAPAPAATPDTPTERARRAWGRAARGAR